MMWVRIEPHSGRDVKEYDKVCQWLAAGRWFPPPINQTLRYNWNIVKHKIKKNNKNPKQTNKQTNKTNQNKPSFPTFSWTSIARKDDNFAPKKFKFELLYFMTKIVIAT